MMQLKEILQQAREFWGKLTTARKIALVAVLTLVLGASAFFALYEPPVDYTTIASNLSEAEAAAIVEQIEADKVQYRLLRTDDSVRIQVPRLQADKVRLAIASRGLESGGFGLDEYISAPYTVSAQREEKMHTIALSREISRILGTLDGVRRAEVILTLPKKSIYLKADDKPRASVVLYLRPGRALSEREVQGIVNLVTNGVDGLERGSVSITDGHGLDLWIGGDDQLLSSRQNAKEIDVRKKIERLLDKAVGPGEHHVTVTATFERSLRTQESEIFEVDPEKSEISKQVTEERRGPSVVNMGPAGARGNKPGAAAANPSEVPGPTRTVQTINRTPSRTWTRTEETEPRLVRLDVGVMINQPAPIVETSSVATASAGVMLARGEVEIGPARPRPDATMLTGLIRAAAGLDMVGRQDTLEIQTVPLWRAPVPVAEAPQAPTPPWWSTLPMWAYGAIAGLAAVLFIATLVSIRRRNRRKAEEEAELLAAPTRADELAAVLEGAEYEPEPTLTELRDKVHEQMELKEDLAAEILTAWINDHVEDEDLEEAA